MRRKKFFCRKIAWVFHTGTNVAFRKPANQSTTVRGGNAGNGNDGQKSTIHDGKQCTETLKEASPWWQVLFEKHFIIISFCFNKKKIKLKSRAIEIINYVCW